ncbi:uncharacterized protein LOC115018542 [Cottoperca gobio]|uniref:Uncharacterized protein LOC115018542 n=1 Tax=Cottoperca gobio TaxID=56716 RepID=A0A6J2R223_COTGO|nr:uncharacterized protein LOC115018542 [Cottoperca gobio]
MDGIDNYIWQRRIHHGVRYQKNAVPFPESVEVGLDFNAALERKEKLDPSLLTNAVMLDVCDFAKTVTKSEMYFLFEMLEFNFDLGVDVDDDQQCYDYAKRTNNKTKLLKDQIKMKPRRRKEKFPLPDLSNIMGSAASAPSGRYYPKRNTIVDSSLLTDGSKNSQSAEDQKMESNGAALMTKEPKGLRFTGGSYPYCKDVGVTLVIRPDDAPKEKLDPNLVTNGAMLEMLDFSRVLCGTHTGIVHDLIKQNFGLELDKTLFRLQLSKLMERKYACLTTEDKEAFRKETFRVQIKKPAQKHKKRKAPDADYQDWERLTHESKRRETLRLKEVDADIWQDSDLSYMCPVDLETEMQLDSEAAPENMVFESCLSETKLLLDVKQEEEEVFVSPVQLQTCDFNPRLPGVRPENTTLKAVSDLFIEDKNEDTNVKTQKQKLWMRRAPRSKQILKSSKVNDMFVRCREIGFDFNVGSGNNQNLDQHLFTNCMLWEVYTFSTAMTKSLRSFLYDILDTNFNLVLQDDLHVRNFFYYLITKERILQNHPDRGKMEFLKSPFQFPEFYNLVDVTNDFQTGQEVEMRQNNLDPSEPTDMKRQPFCKKIGLNLLSTEQRPVSQKLDLTVLTTGAVLEVFVFVRELCGSVHEIVNDLLEHNFDLDLQSGETMAAQVIQRWYATQKSFMKRQTTSPKIVSWLNTVVPLNGHTKLEPQPPTVEDLDSEDVKPKMDLYEDVEKKLIRYRICAEIGLDLNVRCKPEAKTKLDRRVLTRGVLFEMHQYVEQNCNRYVPALYEILEYNFDLSSQNHRKVEFAWSFASQVIAIAGKNGRKGDYLNKVVELPVEDSEFSQVVCKEEPEDCFGELDLNNNDNIVFVRELKPVDIEVVVD